MRRRTTPGLAGYMVAVVVSVGLTGLGLAVSFLPEDGVMGSLAVLVVGTVYAGIFALGAGPVGVLLVHVTCRRVEAQWVHVLAAGIAGVLTGIAFGQLVDVGSSALDGSVLTLILGTSTAIGRAAVIPLARDSHGTTRRASSEGLHPRR